MIVQKPAATHQTHYHNYCWQIYTRSEVRRSLSGDSKASVMLEAHKNAFDYLCSHIEEQKILYLKVEIMTMFRERYLLYLLENHPDYCNENYKHEKLKEKLRKHFGHRIQFWKPSSCQGELLYSEVAFELAVLDEQRIDEAAMIIRRNRTECQSSLDNVPFPHAGSSIKLIKLVMGKWRAES